jgi:hypothetical protein
MWTSVTSSLGKPYARKIPLWPRRLNQGLLDAAHFWTQLTLLGGFRRIAHFPSRDAMLAARPPEVGSGTLTRHLFTLSIPSSLQRKLLYSLPILVQYMSAKQREGVGWESEGRVRGVQGWQRVTPPSHAAPRCKEVSQLTKG